MKKNFTKWFMAIVLTAFMAGCGGGGGGGGGTTPSKLTLSGTAAAGEAMKNATVLLKDVNGKIAQTTTNNEGKYDITAEMTLPVLLKVTSNGKTYYSIATQDGTTNIHPFTDLIIKNWYKVKGKDVETEFTSSGAPSAIPEKEEIDTIESIVRQIISDYILATTGEDPDAFNLITTKFDANGEGFDKVLDVLKVQYDNNTGTATVRPVDPKTQTSGDPIAIIGPNTNISDLAKFKDAINARLSSLKDIINSKGCNLQASDIQDYFEEGILFIGLDVNGFVGIFKEGLLNCSDGGGGSTSGFELIDIDSYDSSTGLLTGMVKVSWKENNIEEWIKLIFGFKQIDGVWKVASNGMVADIHFKVGFDRQYRPDGTRVYRKQLQVYVHDMLDTVSSVRVSGPGFDFFGADGADVPKSCEDNIPTGSQYGCERDNAKREFGYNFSWDANDGGNITLSSPPYVGAVYTVKITKKDNSEVSYPITVLPAPEDFAYPEFKNLNPNTHTLSFTNGKMVISGEVFTPLFVQEIPAPFVGLWNGNVILPYDVECEWTAQPQVGQYNPFSCEIPETFEGASVIYANLGGDANSTLLGGTQSAVYWDFSLE